MLDRMAAEIEMELFQAFNPRRMKKEDARIILEKMCIRDRDMCCRR